jgi:uncharacterized protein
MGLCGDAVKIETKQLQTLLEYQQLLMDNAKLEREAKAIKTALQQDQLHEQMLQISQQLNQTRAAHEDLERDLRRLNDEQSLVTKRLAQDSDRLQKTAVARDAMGLQHEIETLNQRALALEEQAEGVRQEIERSSRTAHELQTQRDQLEQASLEHKEMARLELEALKQKHASNIAQAQELRTTVAQDLLSLFDTKAARGVAIGRLISNSCGACNMSMTAAALSQLAVSAKDDLVVCPQCQAILVR